ncbi:hypothetical protein [Paenibacillus dokdonensis]|uniref:hypothetical protein n=1 Tax=Paenibacillus dokdonensis TaxID=2567944 RepID=UPI0010A90D02|nr:hypothetical protein [Paenibacillus dokdonensis]
MNGKIPDSGFIVPENRELRQNFTSAKLEQRAKNPCRRGAPDGAIFVTEVYDASLQAWGYLFKGESS